MTCFPWAVPIQKGNPFPVRENFIKAFPSLKPLYIHPRLPSFLGQNPNSTQGPRLSPTLSFLSASRPIVHPDRTTYCSPKLAHFLLPLPLHLLFILNARPISPRKPRKVYPIHPSCLNLDITSARKSCWTLLGLVSSHRPLLYTPHHIPYHAELRPPIYLFVSLSRM